MSVLVVLASLLVAASAVPAGSLDNVEDNLKTQTNAITNPVVEGAFNISSSQCDKVKKLLGVDYQQMKKDPPDLNKLTLRYITKDLNVTMNINAAPELLPKIVKFNDEPFIIYFHGFLVNPTGKSYEAISNGFISRGSNNILALDSSSFIGWYYTRATTYVRFIGEKMGSILAQLVQEGLPPKSIHLVGHSLGAHIAGFASKQFFKLTGQHVGRTTGLDPAGPCFAELDSDYRLNPTDADFVMAIHTDAGAFGIVDPSGQVDFFPNDGKVQPGCLFDTCSHGRAWELYAESLLNDNAFLAAHCNSWDHFKKGNCSGTSYMGITTAPGTTGRYYLQTSASSPYGLGQGGASYENNEGFFKSLLSTN